MSRLEELLKKLCPNGVEYKKLGDLGTFYNGLTGKSKTDFTDGNAIFISYMNVYKNMTIDIHTPDRVKIGKNEKQHLIEYGDVLFTGSSETPDECGICSVLTEVTTEPLYLNSFCFGFRFNNKDAMLPDYSKYVFADNYSRKQICATASGVTRFNVSKKLMVRVEIPIPPLQIQREIVRILDEYTAVTDELKSELNAEVTARKLQYSYYSDKLLTFDDSVERKNLGDVATISRGGNFQKKDYVNDGIPCIHYGQIYTTYGLFVDKALCSIPQNIANKQKYAQPNDVVMAVTSENIEDVCKCIAWLGSEPLAVSGHTAIIHHSMNPKYLVYYLRSSHFFEQKVKYAHGIKVIEVTPDRLNGVIIPIPSLEKQKEIVEKLDAFYAITSDFEDNLPKEIELRTKQYEYYRDKLLNFKRKDDA